MKGKIVSIFAIFLLGIVAMTGIAAALPTVEYVKINDEEHMSGDRIVVELGEKIDIKIKLQADSGDEQNIEIEANILGYEYSDVRSISDSTSLFDMMENDTNFKSLSVTIPSNAEKDEYDLRIRIGTRTGQAFEGLYRLRVEGARHNIEIRDIVISPENEVMAGRALLATLRLKNYGERDQDGIKVKVSIPELGVSASDYVDKLKSGDSTTTEELYMRIPTCAEAGHYTLIAEIEYDDGYRTAKKETNVRVVSDESCETATDDKEPTTQTVISVGSTRQDAPRGEGGVIYPLTITNAGKTSKTFIITVEGVSEWATTKMSPGNTVTIGAGETQAVYLYLTANEAAAVGERMFTVTIQSDGKVLKQIPFTANVVAGETSTGDWDKLKRGLVTGLAIIIVLLVLLGLIIGFNKLKGGDDDEDDLDEDGKTYY